MFDSRPVAPDLTVTWLGHAGVVLDLGATRLLTDPLLRRHNGPLRRRGPAPAPDLWRGADAVLLSHLHHDHAEVASLRTADAPVLTAAENAVWVRRKGLTAVDLDEAWYRVGPDVEVRAVPADHHSRPMPHRPNAAIGHLVRSPGARTYVLGDTALTPSMDRVGEWLGGRPDLAVVPIHGWGPRLSGGHMDPEMAAQACARINPRWVLPYHSGTLHPPLLHHFTDYLDRPLVEFREALARAAPGTRLAPVAGVHHVAWQVPTGTGASTH